jgi:hypothetical protein
MPSPDAFIPDKAFPQPPNLYPPEAPPPLSSAQQEALINPGNQSDAQLPGAGIRVLSGEGILEDSIPETVAAVSGKIATGKAIEASADPPLPGQTDPEARSIVQAEDPDSEEEEAVTDLGDAGEGEPPEKTPPTEDGADDGEEQPEEPASPEAADRRPFSVVVEHRRVGDATITVVLCEHEMQNAQRIAQALQDCDVVAMEAYGIEAEALRPQYEEGYESIMEDTVSPEMIDRIHTAALIEGNVGAAILAHLAGTNKQVAVIDISKDDPRYAAVVEADQAEREYARAIYSFAPLGEAQSAGLESARALAKEMEVRDEIMAAQLQDVAEELGQLVPGISIGVVLGKLHHGAVASLGESEGAYEDRHDEVTAEPMSHMQVAEGINQTAGLYNETLVAVRENNPEKATALRDRALISHYLASFLTPAHDQYPARPLSSRYADKPVKELSDQSVEQILTALRSALADPEESPSSKSGKVLAIFLAAGVTLNT